MDNAYASRLMPLTIFSQGLFLVFLIVHSLVATMCNKPSLRKQPYFDTSAITADRPSIGALILIGICTMILNFGGTFVAGILADVGGGSI